MKSLSRRRTGYHDEHRGTGGPAIIAINENNGSAALRAKLLRKRFRDPAAAGRRVPALRGGRPRVRAARRTRAALDGVRQTTMIPGWSNRRSAFPNLLRRAIARPALST